MRDWLASPPGQCLLAWEQAQCDRLLADVFGFHALQLGLAPLQALRANRMPHRWLATDLCSPTPPGDLCCDFSALPFAADSLDLVVLAHTLELSADPHSCLREVHRTLVPGGRLLLLGLNPVGLWAWRQRRARWLRRLGLGRPFLPEQGEWLGLLRLRDWLRLLDLEVQGLHFGCYRPAFDSAEWLARSAWMERVGARAWPFLGAAYALLAVKRVHGMSLLQAPKRSAPLRLGVPLGAAGRASTPAQACAAPSAAPFVAMGSAPTIAPRIKP